MYKFFLCLVFYTTATSAAKILGIFMTPSYSHQVVYQPIWKELSLKGHQVTVITTDPLNDPTLTNLTEIDISFSYDIWKNHSISTLGTKEHSSSEEIKEISKVYFTLTEVQLSHPEVNRLINNTDQMFDLILVEYLWPAMYAFKDIYKCPMVGVTSLGLSGYSFETMGITKHPVLDPEFSLPFATNLSFKERVISTVFHYLFKFGLKFRLLPKVDAVVRKYFGKVRSVAEIYREVSLVIVNSNFALQPVRPTVPAYIEISGIHMKPNKALPQDLQKLLDEAHNGIIYFSLGSNIKSYLLPTNKLDTIMSALSELPYKVLWKFEDDNLKNIPKNVEIRKWLPQQDILAHPNLKLFITQAGLQSLDETIRNEVPILTMPFFGDQRYNSQRMVNNGAALQINFHDFTKEEMKEKIQELITNPQYKTKMSKLKAIITDQPMPALDKAVYWIEYVLRHNGAEHLRYGSLDMPWYQFYLLDVFLFLGSLLILVLYALLKIFRKIVIRYYDCLRFLKYLYIFNNYSNSSEKVHNE